MVGVLYETAFGSTGQISRNAGIACIATDSACIVAVQDPAIRTADHACNAPYRGITADICLIVAILYYRTATDVAGQACNLCPTHYDTAFYAKVPDPCTAHGSEEPYIIMT